MPQKEVLSLASCSLSFRFRLPSVAGRHEDDSLPGRYTLYYIERVQILGAYHDGALAQAQSFG